MTTARVIVDLDFAIGEIDPRLFGSFVEHIGRCVYTGIFEPGHPEADEHGFRRDVLELTRELGVTLVRYPGGNFLSGYNWEDGVGPRETRPKRLDLAWFATEPNSFGTNEFVDWCWLAGVVPFFCVNLGTRGPDDARRLLEYCNHAAGTELSELRRRHGYATPHGIELWGLGNEMDGPWQMGGKTAYEYGRLAKETAKLMRWVDPAVELAACGSSGREMPTFGAWEYEVLDQCYEQVDYLSLHQYFTNYDRDDAEFLAAPDLMDRYICEVVAVCDAVGTKHRSAKKIMLAFDEYNVWWKARPTGKLKKLERWPEAPAFNEEIYNFEDALVLGGALLALLNNADRVKIACLAQLVNVIAPIMTEPGGRAWRQTIFFPFADVANLARGVSLRQAVESEAFVSKTLGELSYLLSSMCHDAAARRVCVFALNRHLTEEMDLTVDLRGLPGRLRLTDGRTLAGFDLDAANSAGQEAVRPSAHPAARVERAELRALLQPASWNVFVLDYEQGL
jgi:alpha-L-arabinofuranosidase